MARQKVLRSCDCGHEIEFCDFGRTPMRCDLGCYDFVVSIKVKYYSMGLWLCNNHEAANHWLWWTPQSVISMQRLGRKSIADLDPNGWLWQLINSVHIWCRCGPHLVIVDSTLHHHKYTLCSTAFDQLINYTFCADLVESKSLNLDSFAANLSKQ